LIPQLDSYVIGHIDSYGNMKTSIPESAMKEKYDYGNTIEITVNNITKQAKYAASPIDGEKGSLVIYPGSAGELQDPYMDIGMNTDFQPVSENTAIREFDRPMPGSIVRLHAK